MCGWHFRRTDHRSAANPALGWLPFGFKDLNPDGQMPNRTNFCPVSCCNLLTARQQERSESVFELDGEKPQHVLLSGYKITFSRPRMFLSEAPGQNFTRSANTPERFPSTSLNAERHAPVCPRR